MGGYGIEIIRYLQSFATPTLTFLNVAISALGSESFFLLSIPLVFIYFGWEKGARFSILLLMSALLNQTLKFGIALPRPFLSYPDVFIFKAGGFSFPSGHAQVSIVYWLGLTKLIKSPLFSGMAILLIFLIGVSRSYLGAHYPSDVLAGWALGGGLWYLYPSLCLLFEKKTRNISTYTLLTITGLIAFIWCLLLPEKSIFSLWGAGNGLILGTLFCKREKLNVRLNSPARLILAGILCVSSTLILYTASHSIFPTHGFWIFLRYFLIGIWMSFGAVRITKKMVPETP